jgi:hypothetical protein
MSNFQQGFFSIVFVFICFFFIGIPPEPVFASDIRTERLDMFIIIDGSSSFERKDAAMGWLCDYAVDGILQEGDRLTIWAASDSAQELFSGPLSGAASKETIKSLIRSIIPLGDTADYSAALKAAAVKEAAAKGLTCTLIISGSQGGHNSFAHGQEAAALLRYSRVLDFAGWRAFITSQSIGSRVRQAAAAFMN